MSREPLPLSYAIETERCRLRVTSEADIPHVLSATRHEGFNDGMLWEPPDSPDELLAFQRQSIEMWKAGESFNFTIDRRSDNAFLGRIGIRRAEGDGRWNIGYFLHPDHQGNGYMREAARAIVAFGFDALEATEIEACCATWHTASERVLRSIPMRYIEHLAEGYKKRGAWVPEYRFAITRQAWETTAH